VVSVQRGNSFCQVRADEGGRSGRQEGGARGTATRQCQRSVVAVDLTGDEVALLMEKVVD